MTHYPTHRNASRQAWKRLRRTMTESESKDIAADVYRILSADVEGMSDLDEGSVKGTIVFALHDFAWETKEQI